MKRKHDNVPPCCILILAAGTSNCIGSSEVFSNRILLHSAVHGRTIVLSSVSVLDTTPFIYELQNTIVYSGENAPHRADLLDINNTYTPSELN